MSLQHLYPTKANPMIKNINIIGLLGMIIILLLLILCSCSNTERGDFNWGTGPGDGHQKKDLIDEIFDHDG